MSVQFGRWNIDGRPVDPEYLAKAESMLAPYGPDGGGSYIKDKVGILYRALHSTGDSRRETQPHICPPGTVITWDGRLDNRTELLHEMRDVLTISAADVAIVSAVYAAWGTACFARLIGDWALSIWDPRNRFLILAKDPAGTRPLYYTSDKDQVAWSTILDPLVLLAGKTFALEEDYLAGWLSFFPATHLTPYVGIQSVPPSCFIRLEVGRQMVSKYWDFDPAKRIRYKGDQQYEEHFRTLFRQAVRRRLRSDRPVLAELSGGMDSSSIVCIADALGASAMADAQRLDTVSYFDDSEPNWDERPYFTRVERQRGRAGLHIDVGLQSCPAINFESERLRILPGAEGEPSSARRKLNAFLTTNGYRVLLSGFGGDEVLGGVPSPISELADSLAGAKARTLSRQLKTWALNQRKPWLHLLFAAASRFFPPALVGASQHLRPAPWLDAGFVHRHRAALTGHEKRLRFFGPLPTFQENLATFEALRRQVGCDAPASEPAYERRTPYLDRELLEFLFAVPREQLVRPGQRRSLMRRALVGVVPQELLDRRRKAFLVRSPLIRIAEQWYAPLCRKNHMVTAFLGIVDAKAFCAEVEKARAGREILPVALIRTAGIEMWLRNLVHHGLLNAERAGYEDAQFAPKECSVSPK